MSRNWTGRWPASPPGPRPGSSAQASWRTCSWTLATCGGDRHRAGQLHRRGGAGAGRGASGGHRQSSRTGVLPRRRLHRLRRRGNRAQKRRTAHGASAFLTAPAPVSSRYRAAGSTRLRRSAAEADIRLEVPTYKHTVSHSDRGATVRGPRPGREGRHRLARGQPLAGDHYGGCSGRGHATLEVLRRFLDGSVERMAR
jgi:hypothetical protein